MNEKQKLQERYGNLFDGFLERPQIDYQTQREQEKEAKKRYGNLLDYAKPDQSVYDNLMGVETARRQMRQQREEDDKLANLRWKERIDREQKEKQKHREENDAFVQSCLEKKEREERIQRERQEQKRKEEEEKQSVRKSLQRLGEIANNMTEKSAQIEAIRSREEERRKEYEKQMDWYRSQRK